MEAGEIFDRFSGYVALAACVSLLLLLPLYFSQRRDLQRLRVWRLREPDHPAADLEASELLLDRAETELEELLGEPEPEPEAEAGATPATPMPAAAPGAPPLKRKIARFLTSFRAHLAGSCRWLAAVGRWVAEARLAWFALFIVAIALVFSLRPGASEGEIRMVGLALQCLGIGVVLRDLGKTRRLFGLPGVMRLLHSWISRFPRWPRPQAVGGVFVAAGSSALSGTGHVWRRLGPSATTEDLVQSIEDLQQRLVQLETDVDSKLRDHHSALREEEQKRGRGHSELSHRLEAAETGGLHLALVGLVWLLLGLLLSTLSDEISRWIQ